VSTAMNVLGEGYELCGGRYRIEDRIGYGGMASVWLGCDTRLGRRVAIKVLSDTLASDPGYVERFRREARIAARLSHPNLVKVFDYEPDNRPALVMEYIEGGTLDEATRNPGTAVEPEALATQLLGALAHIHAAGIVHRDVKPGNVLIDDDGRALLTDFGIAQPENATRMTQTGQVIGTIEYMAPEVREGGRATPQSDLYSAGVLLRDHLGDDPAQALRRLVERLTDSDPDRRPSSAKRALAYIAPSRLPAEPDAAVIKTEPMDLPQADGPPTEERAIAPDDSEPVPSPQPRETDEWDALSAPLAETGPRGPGAETGARDQPSLSDPPPPRREHTIGIRHVLAGLALLAAAIVAVAIATSGGSDDPSSAAKPGGSDEPNAEKTQPAEEEPAADEPPAEEPAPTPETTAPIPEPAVDADPAAGAQLNNQAFETLNSGDAAGAVTTYEEALAQFPTEARTPEAFGQYPDYAYALYGYADALLQVGRADEAVAVLKERRKFADQRETVDALLAEAEAAAAGE
jgi:eukaryotic-like serine/threonine-protein kinase